MVPYRPVPAIAHYAPVWLPRTETWLYNQIRYLPPRYRCHVVCERTEHLDRFPVADLHALSGEWKPFVMLNDRLRAWGWITHSMLLARRMREHGCALLHSHFGPEGWRQLPVARARGVPHVVTFYGYDVNKAPRTDPRWRPRYRDLFAAVDRVLCEGEFMAARITDLGCPPEKVRVHRLGVDLDRLAFRPRRPPVSGEATRILIAGTFREKKGIPDALRAVAALATDRPVSVTLVGDAAPREGAERARIDTTLRETGLGDRVDRRGWVTHDELIELAYDHHLFLSPSRTAADGDTEGGAPVAIIEMAATGLPVVSTTHCDIPGVIRHRETGYLAPEGDVAEVAAGLRWWLDAPGSWEARLTAGRRHLEARFDGPRQGRALGEIYAELLERRG